MRQVSQTIQSVGQMLTEYLGLHSDNPERLSEGNHATVPDDIEPRRKVPRQRVLRRGMLVGASLPDQPVNVIVRDISSEGAKLQMPEPWALPEFFDLVLITDSKRYTAKLLWQKDLNVGVCFMGPPKPDHLRRR